MAGRYPGHRRTAGWGRQPAVNALAIRKFVAVCLAGGNPALWRACGLDQDFKIARRARPADAA
jgi:hypothetical protein